MWLGDRWNDFAHRFFPHLRVNERSASIAGDLLVLLSAIVIAVAAARLLAAFQVSRDRRVTVHTRSGPARSAHALVAQARQAAQAGNYAEAVRIAFVAAITLLDLRGIVQDDAAATINDVRRALRERDPAAEAPFVELARAYTDAAYAERPVDAALWERTEFAYRRLADRAQT